MALSNKQQVWLESYLTCWNATEAGRVAGYAFPNVEGPKNLVNPSIQEAIQARLIELKASADEVVTRLTDHARGSLEPFIRRDKDGDIVGYDLSEDKPLHLLKKMTITKRKIRDMEETVITAEIHDAQAALALLGRHHKLFTDKIEATINLTPDEAAKLTDEELDERLRKRGLL